MVLTGTLGFPGNFLVTQVALNASGIADYQASRRTLKLGLDEGSGGDNGFGTDDGIIHDNGIYSNQGITANTATVQYGSVPDVPIHLDNTILARKAMHDAGVLKVTALLQHNAAKIASKNGIGSDVAISRHYYIPDKNGSGMNIRGFIDNRYQVVHGITGHFSLQKFRLIGYRFDWLTLHEATN